MRSDIWMYLKIVYAHKKMLSDENFTISKGYIYFTYF